MHLSLTFYRTDRPASPVFMRRLPTVAVRRHDLSLWAISVVGFTMGVVVVLLAMALV